MINVYVTVFEHVFRYCVYIYSIHVWLPDGNLPITKFLKVHHLIKKRLALSVFLVAYNCVLN
jgi:hypothetical protein